MDCQQAHDRVKPESRHRNSLGKICSLWLWLTQHGFCHWAKLLCLFSSLVVQQSVILRIQTSSFDDQTLIVYPRFVTRCQGNNLPPQVHRTVLEILRPPINLLEERQSYIRKAIVLSMERHLEKR